MRQQVTGSYHGSVAAGYAAKERVETKDTALANARILLDAGSSVV
jgi:hypothetical protein